MSYHSPDITKNKSLGSAAARMPVMPKNTVGNISKNVAPASPAGSTTEPKIYMDELGIATAAEKNKKGYLSTYLEGQTPMAKLSHLLGGTKL